MANKSVVRVQVSLRRVVDFNDENSGNDEKGSNDKASEQASKRSKVQDSR